MVSSRTATALVGLLGSLIVSIAAWVYYDTLLFFLIVPFVPLLFRRQLGGERPSVKRCPVCGYETREPSYTHCSRDGAALE